MNEEIKKYHLSLQDADQEICDVLFQLIDTTLKEASAKVWHGHPVWFLDGNPVVGYSKRKNDICLLFWSGQSFDEPTLKASGKFKAAELHFNHISELDITSITRSIEKSAKIQWDYKNIVKRKGVLELLY